MPSLNTESGTICTCDARQSFQKCSILFDAIAACSALPSTPRACLCLISYGELKTQLHLAVRRCYECKTDRHKQLKSHRPDVNKQNTLVSRLANGHYSICHPVWPLFLMSGPAGRGHQGRGFTPPSD